MSKGQKKKLILKIFPGEAAIVASVDVLEHIYETYLYMASSTDSVESGSWQSVAELIREWIDKTQYSDQGDYEEEW
jgi:hypothetical protein